MAREERLTQSNHESPKDENTKNSAEGNVSSFFVLSFFVFS
jgi:hypothetical protein